MNPNRPPITWTPRMINTLREYYPTMFNDALAKLLKVSVRSLQRKAQELGLVKVKDFNQVRSYDIAKRISDAVKKAYADGRKTSDFKKGVRNNPDGEFKPGHRFPEEIESARKDKIRKTFKRQKLLQIYGLK